MAPTRRTFLVRSMGIAAAAGLPPACNRAAAIHPEPLPTSNTPDTSTIGSTGSDNPLRTGSDWAERFADALQAMSDDPVEVEYDDWTPNVATVRGNGAGVIIMAGGDETMITIHVAGQMDRMAICSPLSGFAMEMTK